MTVAKEITHLQKWGTWCLCPEHADAHAQGKHVDCDQRGRLMSECYDKAKSTLDSFLHEAEGWTVAEWGSDPVFLQGIIGSARLCHRRGLVKVDHYKRIPCLFAKLDDPIVCKEAIDQFDSCDKSFHHRESIKVCDTSGMRQDVIDSSNGAPLSARLNKVRKRFKSKNINDTVIEGPHARANRYSTASTWPRGASSMRSRQNVRRFRAFDRGTWTQF